MKIKEVIFCEMYEKELLIRRVEKKNRSRVILVYYYNKEIHIENETYDIFLRIDCNEIREYQMNDENIVFLFLLIYSKIKKIQFEDEITLCRSLHKSEIKLSYDELNVLRMHLLNYLEKDSTEIFIDFVVEEAKEKTLFSKEFKNRYNCGNIGNTKVNIDKNLVRSLLAEFNNVYKRSNFQLNYRNFISWANRMERNFQGIPYFLVAIYCSRPDLQQAVKKENINFFSFLITWYENYGQREYPILHKVITKLEEEKTPSQAQIVAIVGNFENNTGLYQQLTRVEILSSREASFIYLNTNSEHSFQHTNSYKSIQKYILQNVSEIILVSPIQELSILLNDIKCLIELSTKKILYYTWETDTIPNVYVKDIDIFDKVITISNFTAESLPKSSKKKVEVYPPTFSKSDFVTEQYIRSMYDEKYEKNEKILLSIMDPRSSLERKNLDDHLDLFTSIYPSEQNKVKFIIKTYNIKAGDMFKFNSYKILYERNDVELINEMWSAADLQQLIRNSYMYLSLHKGEGFGFNIFDSIRVGTLVFATYFGGNEDYMEKSAFSSIPFTLRPAQNYAKYLNLDPKEDIGFWAEPNISVAQKRIQACFENKELLISSAIDNLRFVKSKYNL